MPKIIKTVSSFPYGILSSLEEHSIPFFPGAAASNSVCWLTKGDKIELSKGRSLLGTAVTGSGKVTSLFTARQADGTEVLFRTYARKILYYIVAAGAWSELGTNTLPAAASGEDISWARYDSPAGVQVWASSPNSSLYKLMLANLGAIEDQYDSTKNYKGKIAIKNNRMILFGRVADRTGVYLSYIDKQTYTTVATENIGTGDGTTKTFTDTLAFKAGGAKRTCFAITATDGTETFTDDNNGVLTGSAGGTGTINYDTGAISVTFFAAPANLQAITADYQWEDSTNNGIADFMKSTPRTAGQGAIFRQDDGGGDIQNVMTYNSVEYCMHQFKTWQLTIGADDTAATNLIYRDRVGIPTWRAAVETGDGIYYIDDADKEDPHFRLLTLGQGSTEVIPRSISKQRKYEGELIGVNLKDYRFNAAAMIEFGDMILIACRHKDSDNNNTIFIYDKIQKTIDKLSYYVSCFAIFNDQLIGGCSIDNNVYILFDGYNDNLAVISNKWESGITDLGIEQMKKTKKLVVEGEIAINQTINVYLSIDRGIYELIGSVVGTGSYVDSTSTSSAKAIVGAAKVGQTTVGGVSGSTTQFHYKRELKISDVVSSQSKFENAKIKFEATAFGYASVSSFSFWDVRAKRLRIKKKYRA